MNCGSVTGGDLQPIPGSTVWSSRNLESDRVDPYSRKGFGAAVTGLNGYVSLCRETPSPEIGEQGAWRPLSLVPVSLWHAGNERPVRYSIAANGTGA